MNRPENRFLLSSAFEATNYKNYDKLMRKTMNQSIKISCF